jgi:hypothetical protein
MGKRRSAPKLGQVKSGRVVYDGHHTNL